MIITFIGKLLVFVNLYSVSSTHLSLSMLSQVSLLLMLPFCCARSIRSTMVRFPFVCKFDWPIDAYFELIA